jgi:hypothetical protein
VACVYDWLLSVLIPAYDFIALTVPSWTTWATECVLFLDHSCSAFLEAEIAQGLRYISKIILCAEADVYTLTVPDLDLRRDTSHPDSIEQSLNESVTLPRELLQGQWYWPYPRDRERHSPQLVAMFMNAPLHEDEDLGPETAWRWAHQSASPPTEPRSGLVLSDPQIPLREMGYVFWAHTRLQSWGLLRSEYEGLSPAHRFERSKIRSEELDRVPGKIRVLADEIETKRRAASRAAASRGKGSDDFFLKRYA